MLGKCKCLMTVQTPWRATVASQVLLENASAKLWLTKAEVQSFTHTNEKMGMWSCSPRKSSAVLRCAGAGIQHRLSLVHGHICALARGEAPASSMHSSDLESQIRTMWPGDEPLQHQPGSRSANAGVPRGAKDIAPMQAHCIGITSLAGLRCPSQPSPIHFRGT